MRGNEVRFVKEYIGEQFAGWRIGDQVFGESVATQPIRYTGTLSNDGNNIEGRWSITVSDKKSSAAVGGTFQLQRQPE